MPYFRRESISSNSSRKERIIVKSVVRKAKREAEGRFGEKLSHNFERNRKMFWTEVKRVRKREQKDEMRMKDRDGNMLLEEIAVMHR